MSTVPTLLDGNTQTSQRGLRGWVTYKTSTLTLGTVPPNFYLDKINLHVTEAFNAGSSNNISVGYSGSAQAFGTNTAAGTTGIKTVSLGTAAGVNTVARAVIVTYAQSGGAPTTGKAFVEVQFRHIPPSP